jgi:hypothetical protein
MYAAIPLNYHLTDLHSVAFAQPAAPSDPIDHDAAARRMLCSAALGLCASLIEHFGEDIKALVQSSNYIASLLTAVQADSKMELLGEALAACKPVATHFMESIAPSFDEVRRYHHHHSS